MSREYTKRFEYALLENAGAERKDPYTDEGWRFNRDAAWRLFDSMTTDEWTEATVMAGRAAKNGRANW